MCLSSLWAAVEGLGVCISTSARVESVPIVSIVVPFLVNQLCIIGIPLNPNPTCGPKPYKIVGYDPLIRGSNP